jgi:hypothetical protein
MLLQLPANPDGHCVRIVIEGEGVHQTTTVSSEITEIEKRFADEVNEDNLAANAWFLNAGGKQVGDLIVLKTAADAPPPLDTFQRVEQQEQTTGPQILLPDEPIRTKLDEEVAEANEAIRVEDQDADMGPELKLESTNEEVALEDRQEDGVETDESVADEPDPVVDESKMTDKYPSRRRRRKGK